MNTEKLRFNVDGLTYMDHIMWFSWPNDIRTALGKQSGVKKVEFDSDTNIFTIEYDPSKFSKNDIAPIVEAVGKSKGKHYKLELAG